MRLHNAKLCYANLKGADLRGAGFRHADLTCANLSNADLRWAGFYAANLTGVQLTNAKLQGTDLRKACLRDSNLRKAYLRDTNLREADLTDADLTNSNLTNAIFVETNLTRAILSGSRVYGASIWTTNLTNTVQNDLIITPVDESTVTVDDLEVAQFIYLLLNRNKLRKVINTINTKAVLILGRFTPERKLVLDLVAEQLRKNGLLPIIFDFQRPTELDFTETIRILAGLSIFVVVDITSPKSSPLELQATVPNYQIPFVPIIQEGEKPFSMFNDLKKYHWVLKPIEYSSLEQLISNH